MQALMVALAVGALLFPVDLLQLVELHRPDGEAIYVNPHEVSSLREPSAQAHFAMGTRCLIYVTSGNFITVRETCMEAVKKLAAPLVPQ